MTNAKKRAIEVSNSASLSSRNRGKEGWRDLHVHNWHNLPVDKLLGY